MKIKSIIYNWQDDQYNTYREIGQSKVTNIEVHYPQGEGDKMYAIISFEDGHCDTVFNINKITTEY